MIYLLISVARSNASCTIALITRVNNRRKKKYCYRISVLERTCRKHGVIHHPGRTYVGTPVVVFMNGSCLSACIIMYLTIIAFIHRVQARRVYSQ